MNWWPRAVSIGLICLVAKLFQLVARTVPVWFLQWAPDFTWISDKPAELRCPLSKAFSGLLTCRAWLVTCKSMHIFMQQWIVAKAPVWKVCATTGSTQCRDISSYAHFNPLLRSAYCQLSLSIFASISDIWIWIFCKLKQRLTLSLATCQQITYGYYQWPAKVNYIQTIQTVSKTLLMLALVHVDNDRINLPSIINRNILPAINTLEAKSILHIAVRTHAASSHLLLKKCLDFRRHHVDHSIYIIGI